MGVTTEGVNPFPDRPTKALCAFLFLVSVMCEHFADCLEKKKLTQKHANRHTCMGTDAQQWRMEAHGDPGGRKQPALTTRIKPKQRDILFPGTQHRSTRGTGSQ